MTRGDAVALTASSQTVELPRQHPEVPASEAARDPVWHTDKLVQQALEARAPEMTTRRVQYIDLGERRVGGASFDNIDLGEKRVGGGSLSYVDLGE